MRCSIYIPYVYRMLPKTRLPRLQFVVAGSSFSGFDAIGSRD